MISPSIEKNIVIFGLCILVITILLNLVKPISRFIKVKSEKGKKIRDNIEKILIRVLSIVVLITPFALFISKNLLPIEAIQRIYVDFTSGILSVSEVFIRSWLFFSCILLPLLVVYLLIICALKLIEVKSVIWQVIFALVFISSVVFCTADSIVYNQSIQTISEVNHSSKEYELIKIGTLPIVSKGDKVIYWYLTDSGSGDYNEVPATNVNIIFMTEAGISKVEIIESTTTSKKVDKFGTVVLIGETKTNKTYNFYLPESYRQKVIIEG